MQQSTVRQKDKESEVLWSLSGPLQAFVDSGKRVDWVQDSFLDGHCKTLSRTDKLRKKADKQVDKREWISGNCYYQSK